MLRDEAAVLEGEDPVGDVEDARVVRHEDDGRALLAREGEEEIYDLVL